MVKEIEIYDGKNILVDFDKLESKICNIFAIFIFILFGFIFDYLEGLGAVSLKDILLIVITGVTTICLIATKILSGNFKLNKYFIILLVYTTLIILSCAFSKYSDKALFGSEGRGEGAVTLITYIMCFYIFYSGFKFNNKVFDYITAAMLVFSGFGIVQSLLSDNFDYYLLGFHPYMGQSNFGNPNMFSSLLLLVLPLYVVKYYNSSDKIYLWILGIIFAALVGTKTFSGYFTFAFVFAILAIYFIIIWKNKKEITFKVLGLFATFAGIFILMNAVNDNVYYEEIVSNNIQIQVAFDENVQQFGNNRGYIWSLACEIISKYPWLGVGPDSFGSEVMRVYMDRDDYIFGKIITDKAHNEYLQIAATTGIPSLVVYIVFLFTILISLLIKYINNVKQGKILEKNTMAIVGVTASIVAYMIQAVGNISIFYVAPMFWAIIGIGAKVAEKEVIE